MESELSRVMDALPGMVWTALPDGNFDFLNKHWCDYTGMCRDEARGVGWQAAVHPDDLPHLMKRWQRILASGLPQKMVARLRRTDGTYRRFEIHLNPLTDASGRIEKWCGTNTEREDESQEDGTGDKPEQQPSTIREHHCRSIVDGLPALVTLIRPTGEFEFANRQVQEYFGRTLEDLREQPPFDGIAQEDVPAAVAAWNRAVATEEPYEIEYRIRRADGMYRWFNTRGSPLRDARGRIVLWYLLQTDVNERKHAEVLLAGERHLLEMVTRGQPMSAVLEGLCHLVETVASECYCSIVLVDPSGTRLEHGAAPSLPSSFIDSIVGRPVNVDSGPCAMAAYLNEQVVADNLATETRWADYKWCPMAMAHGLYACWSTPISSSAGKALGAFAIYYDEPRTPSPLEQRMIEQFSHIANIAVERAQADAALKRSEARSAAILDSALDCIITMDHEGRISEFNPAAERTFGYRRDDVLGQSLADIIIPPAFRAAHQRGFARYLATGETTLLGWRVELMAMRADGSEFPVELAVTRISLDGPPSFTGYLRDITERKRSEEELRRSEAFLAQGQRLSSTGTFSWRVATDEITWSEQTYRIFDFDPGVAVTLPLIATRVHPDDMPLMYDMVNNARGEGPDFKYEHRLLMPDGSIKYLYLVGRATRDHNGQLEYIGAVQDITQRHLSEEALGKARSEFARVARVTSLGALTASIAHELNQPLSGIVTNASTCLRMLASDPPNVDGACETARRTIRDGNRASDVIARLRTLFSRKDPVHEAVDLNEAAREVIALLRSELQRNRILLRVELGDNIPAITGDRVQLQQVILNLIRNASDAMGDIDDRPRQLVIGTERKDDNSVRLSVQDAGIGIVVQDQDRLFDAFYTTKSGGMGIGLSVSRSIVESHHGRLWATRNDGPGATFAFSIPLQPDRSRYTGNIKTIWTPRVTNTQHA